MKAINPSTGQIIKSYAEHPLNQVQSTLMLTQTAWLGWRESDMKTRSRLMHKAAEILRGKKEEYALLMSREMGKVIGEARAEIEKCAWVCDFYADHAENF